MASNDASNAIEAFQPITKVIGTPTFTAINARHQVLRQNASSVLTTLAGGNHGLLALIVNAQDNTALTGAVWIEPVNPGMRPVIPIGSTRVAQENITSQWKIEFEAWKMTQDVREALKKQLINALDDEYLEDLKDPDTGYANVTPLQMIEHLYDEYGELTPQDISNNKTDLKADFDPNTTMVSYFYKIREIRNVAVRAGNPMRDNDVIAELYLVMAKTGIFDKTIDEWDELDAAAKTWARFQTHFKTAYKRYQQKLRRQNTAGGTRPVANQAIETLATTMESHLANYANAATADRESVANLTQANATLVATNAELTTKMNTCLIEIAKMQAEIQKIQTRGRNSRSGRGGGRGTGTSTVTETVTGTGTGTSTGTADWKYYCYSCGLTNDRNHTSMNCPTPKANHKRHATLERKFGGSTVGCPATT